MSAFRIYNIQLLPLNTKKTEEVGVEGYLNLFELLQKRVSTRIKDKKIIDYSDPLVNDTFICPFTIHRSLDRRYSYGEFIKYHKASEVLDIFTQTTLYSADARSGAVSNIYLFRFVFDHETHRLAIEEQGGKLPNVVRFLKTLEFFLKPIADDYFQDYTLTINLVSDNKQLQQVLKEASYYSKVHVRLTFPNGPLNEVLKELKDNNVHRVEHSASSERGAMMPGLTKYTKSLLENASKFGEASITYYKNASKTTVEKLNRFTFKTKNFPIKISLRQGVDETDLLYLERVWFKLTNKPQKKIKDDIQKIN